MSIEPEFGSSQNFPISWLFDPRRSARSLGEEHPGTLYHYTNDAGLKGIIEPQSWDIKHPGLVRAAQLWATDVRYMNDSRELLFGAAPLVDRLRMAAIDPAVDPKLSDAMSRLARVFDGDNVLSWTLRCFAACLSDASDAVNQWQGYAGRGGYAIGFSWDVLSEHSYALHPNTTVMGTTPSAVGLRRMSYGTPAAEALADSWVSQLRAAYDQADSFLGTMLRDRHGFALIYVASIILGDLAAVKHGAFQHEREWRLVALSEPGYPAKTRLRGEEDLPYIDVAVNLNEPVNSLSTIAQLVVGPGYDQPGRMAAAHELLERNGHDPAVVVAYDGPLRW